MKMIQGGMNMNILKKIVAVGVAVVLGFVVLAILMAVFGMVNAIG